MNAIDLDIESFTISGFDGDPQGVRPVLQAALSLVATRLAKSPFARMPNKRLALAELELGTLSAQEIIAPGGAEKLAEALYQSLERNLT
jgi:hypothetical protein